jgi:hypothetical protein
MVPGFGQQPRFVVTIQPVGTRFNPPAAITIPNVDGLAPRSKTEMYSYDHDLASFVAIGTGTVSEDGSVIASDPGVGVIKAGWHCGGNPNPTGSAGTCPTCKKCVSGTCVPDPAQQPQQECKECRNGTLQNTAAGPNPRNTSNCCFDGQTVSNTGLGYNDLTAKCPQRIQNNRTHEVDGCTNSPDDPTYLNYLFLSLAQNSTAFGSEETPAPGQTAPSNPLPCNWHDFCYQTCARSNTQDSCDRDLQTRAHAVCDNAYPEPNPYALLNPLHLAYISQRAFCHGAADTYYNVLSLAGGGAYRERQEGFCNCCR